MSDSVAQLIHQVTRKLRQVGLEEAVLFGVASQLYRRKSSFCPPLVEGVGQEAPTFEGRGDRTIDDTLSFVHGTGVHAAL